MRMSSIVYHAPHWKPRPEMLVQIVTIGGYILVYQSGRGVPRSRLFFFYFHSVIPEISLNLTIEVLIWIVDRNNVWLIMKPTTPAELLSTFQLYLPFSFTIPSMFLPGIISCWTTSEVIQIISSSQQILTCIHCESSHASTVVNDTD